MKNIKKIIKKVLSPAQRKRNRKAKKVEKLAYQLELNAMLGDVQVNYLDDKYPYVFSSPRENANVNNNRMIPELMEQGKLNDELIAKGYGKRTKIEMYRAAFDLKKGK